MIYNELSTAEKVPFNFDGRIMFRSERYELVHLTLQPGEAMQLHHQPFDVVFFTVEGTGTLVTESGESQVKINSTVLIEKGVQRAWRNDTDSVFRVLVNKLL